MEMSTGKSAREQRTGSGARTIAACAAMQGIGGGLGWSLLPPLMGGIAKDLGISHAMGGVVWGSASLGIALASPLGGAAVDRYGARRVAGIAMLVGAVACAARALAVGPWSLALLMMLFGAHIGFVAPAIPKALAGEVPLPRLGRANGIALLFYTLGTALSVLVARTVIAPALGGWRPTMVAASVAMAVVGGVWFAVVRDRTAPIKHASIRDVLALAKLPELRRVGSIHFLLFGGYLALLGILPRALAEAGLPLTKVGWAVASWLLVAALANFTGPVTSDRIGRRRPFVVVGGAVAGLALLALAFAPKAAVVPLLCVAAAGGGCFAPLLMALPAEMAGVGPARAGAALGLLMLIGQAGGFLLPTIAGAALQARGFSVAIGVLAVAHLAIVIPALGLTETGSKARPSTPPEPMLHRNAA
ncbi:MAG: MFS transporter [Polyangiales bacterium]